MTCIPILLITAMFTSPVAPVAPVQYYYGGLISHNTTYAGAQFDDLWIGDTFTTECENGKKVSFKVTQIKRYYAETPVYFKDLSSGKWYDDKDLFDRFYNQEDRTVLQTCIRYGNNWTWGRLFVIGKVIKKPCETGELFQRGLYRCMVVQ